MSIDYDAIGNPLSYYNGSSYTFSWTGRQLTGATKSNVAYSFTYNDEGIRTTKTKGGVTTTYYLDGSRIVAEETSDNVTVYLYDNEGLPIGMQYRAESYANDVWDAYWYERNLQGDVVAVYNSAGTKLVSYTYDAWGNTTVTYHNGGASTTATKNPFRYRGYYYDVDLGLYYLNTRYYDANTGRFISPDSYVSTGQGLLGYNMYAYCNNNPIMHTDYTGESFLGFLALAIVCAGFYDIMVSTIVSPFSNDNETTGALVPGTTGYSNYGLGYYDVDVDTVLDETYRVGAEVGIYTETYSLKDSAVNFDVGKAGGSLGYFGATAGVYLTEISLEQTYSIFGKEVTFSAGVNTGLGASFSFGKKTVIGATYGWGLVFSFEVK